MPSYKFTYFAGRGRGELSRLLFAVSGTPFEDVRVEFPDWPALKPKTPLGSMPILETDGKTLVQSLSIARFLANKFGLLGKSVEDQAIADMIVATCEDVRVNLVPVLFEQDAAAKAKKIKEFKEKAETKMNFLEKKLKENGEYFVGKSLTWADLAVFDILFTVAAQTDMMAKYPCLKAHKDTVLKNAKISEYCKNRPETAF